MNEAPVWSPDGSQIAFVDCSKSGAAGVNCQIAVLEASVPSMTANGKPFSISDNTMSAARF